jgi:hypothetical protein
MATNLTIGANYIAEIELLDTDGNTVTVASAESLSIQIRQHGRLYDTYVYGTDDELQDGSTASKLYIEITQELSARLKEGKVYARAIISNTDADYTVDTEQVSLPDYHILTMYVELPEDEDSVTTVIEHYRGFYDASVNAAPSSGGAGTGGAILGGDWWSLSVAGTIFGTPRSVGDTITALVNSPGQTSSNWQFQSSNP